MFFCYNLGINGKAFMISDPADAKSIILSLLGDGTSSSQLGVAQLEGEPDYWLVTILAENGESLVSGSAYVVKR